MSINISDLTIGQARELAVIFGSGDTSSTNPVGPFQPLMGKNVMVRTVTMILVGHLEAVYPGELVLIDAAWIPDTGRYKQFISEGVFDECEPYPDGQLVIVGRGALVDLTEWNHPLPREQK